MDFVTQLPKSPQRYDSAMVISDKFTKRIHITPLSTVATAPIVARAFFDTVVRHHGIPQTIISDRDSRFTSHFWRELFKLTGSKLAMSTANHPQTDGQSERAIRVLKEALKHYISHSQCDWPDHLAAIEFAYNSAKHSTTGHSPFHLEYGVQPTLLKLPQHLDSPVQTTNKFVESWQTHLRIANDLLNQSALQQLDGHPRFPVTLKPGDQVMVSARVLETPETRSRPSRKLAAKYIGPFTVIRQLSHQAYEVDLPNHISAHRTINGEHLSKVSTPLRVPDAPPPLADDDSGKPVYEVEALLTHRFRGKHWNYS